MLTAECHSRTCQPEQRSYAPPEAAASAALAYQQMLAGDEALDVAGSDGAVAICVGGANVAGSGPVEENVDEELDV